MRKKRGRGSRKGDDLLDSLRPQDEQTRGTGPGAQDPKKTTPPLPPPAAEEARDTGPETGDSKPGAPDKGEVIPFPGRRKQDTEDPKPKEQDPEPGTSEPDISPSPTEPLEEELAGLGVKSEVFDEELPSFDDPDELPQPQDSRPETEDAKPEAQDPKPRTEDPGPEPEVSPSPFDEGLPSFDAPDELPQPQDPVPETEDPKPKEQDPKPRTEDPGPKPDTGHRAPEPDIAPSTQDPEPETGDEGLPGLGSSGPGPQPSPTPIPFPRSTPKDPERGTQDPKPETQDPGHKTPGPDEDRELNAWLDGAPDVTYRGGTKGESALVLVQMFNDKEVKEITIQQDTVKIGKLEHSHLLISGDKDVSRLHAVMEYAGGDWMIIDLGSAIGTFVNGKKVNKSEIKEGDEIKIGSAVFRVKEIKEMKPDKQDAGPDAQDPGHGAQDTERPPGPPESKVSGEIDTSNAQAQGSQQAQEQRNANAGDTMMVDRGISWSDAITKDLAVKSTLVLGGMGATYITAQFGVGNWALVPAIAGLAAAVWYTINDKRKR